MINLTKENAVSYNGCVVERIVRQAEQALIH